MDTCNQLFRGLADGCDYDVIPFFRRFHKIAKRDYKLRHVRPSVSMEQLGSH